MPKDEHGPECIRPGVSCSRAWHRASRSNRLEDERSRKGENTILLENLSLGENNRDIVDLEEYSGRGGSGSESPYSLLIEDENSKSFGIRKTCEHVFDVLLEGSVHVANGDLRSHLSKD